MRKSKDLIGLAFVVALLVGGAAGCDGDSPTSGEAPTIAQLRVDGAIRVDGDVGIVLIRFDYMDRDRDIATLLFVEQNAGGVSNQLSGANQLSGTVSLQQAVHMPAAGVEVPFSVSVVDRRGNRSNELTGSFVAPV